MEGWEFGREGIGDGRGEEERKEAKASTRSRYWETASESEWEGDLDCRSESTVDSSGGVRIESSVSESITIGSCRVEKPDRSARSGESLIADWTEESA